MRKILAVVLTLITLYAIKETWYILTSNNAEIVSHKKQLNVIVFSITFPLIILTLWLWRPKPKTNN